MCWGYSSVVECLLRKHKILGSLSTTSKTKTKLKHTGKKKLEVQSYNPSIWKTFSAAL